MLYVGIVICNTKRTSKPLCFQSFAKKSCKNWLSIVNSPLFGVSLDPKGYSWRRNIWLRKKYNTGKHLIQGLTLQENLDWKHSIKKISQKLKKMNEEVICPRHKKLHVLDFIIFGCHRKKWGGELSTFRPNSTFLGPRPSKQMGRIGACKHVESNLCENLRKEWSEYLIHITAPLIWQPCPVWLLSEACGAGL